jgi:hypothetical protein
MSKTKAWLTMKHGALWILFALPLLGGASSALAQSTGAERLDDLLRRNQTIELARLLQGRSIDRSTKSAWLEKRANEGHAVAQYQLSYELMDRDKARAIDWYAKARLARILDETECANRSMAEEIGLLIDLGYQALQRLADANEALYAAAIDKALREEQEKTTQVGPNWICSAGAERPDQASLLPIEERRRKREAARSFLFTRGQARIIEARLNANLNPDRFAIRSIPVPLKGNSGSGGLAWIDNQVLLLVAYEGTGRRALYSWDTRTNRVNKIADPVGALCAYRGFVSYAISRDGIWFRREGKVGEEIELVEPKSLDPNYVVFRCHLIPRDQWPYEWPYLALEAGGILKFPSRGEDRSKVPLKLIPDASNTPIELPIFSDQMLTASTSYSEYLNAHWITRHTGRTSETEAGRIWVIYPDGRVKTVDVPPGPWVSLSGNYPVRDGWVFANFNGLYYWSGSEVKKLLHGTTEAVAVSPSGCGLAVKIGPPSAMADLDHSFKIVDLCNGHT